MRNAINLLPTSYRRQQLVRRRARQWSAIICVVLLIGWGLEWARRPTLLPALIVGLGTIVAPFFILQPCMGAGIAASKMPQPNLARVKSLVTHTIYGLGLYVSGQLWALLGQG